MVSSCYEDDAVLASSSDIFCRSSLAPTCDSNVSSGQRAKRSRRLTFRIFWSARSMPRSFAHVYSCSASAKFPSADRVGGEMS